MKRWGLVLKVLAVAMAVTGWLWVRHERAPILISVGPRLVSNDTQSPLALYGKNFRTPLHLKLGAPFERTLPLSVVDASHAYLRLPADLELPPAQAEAQVTLSLEGGRGEVTLSVINNRHFPELKSLARGGSTLLAASLTTDTGYLVESGPKGPSVKSVPLGDGPSAVGVLHGPGATTRYVVLHRYGGELWLLSEDGQVQTKLPAPVQAVGLAVDSPGRVAYIAEEKEDTVLAVGLDTGRVLWRTKVAPNPRELAITEAGIAVGSLQAGTVDLLASKDGKLLKSIQPQPGTPIIGGHTAPYAEQVMGGTGVRALAYSTKLKRLFVASIGPNIGPNKDRMEVSMNGGVSVVDLAAGKVERHVGFGAGIPQALALDDEHHRLYVADIGLGQVHVLDAAALAGTNETASKAGITNLLMPLPGGFPLVRPASDFGVNRRAGVEMHSGPGALVLSEDGKGLDVLNRFTGTLVHAADLLASPRLSATPLTGTLEQADRREGEILYYTDMGRSGMSCDACHPDGHTEGVLFAKTHPLRIYRSPTVRGSRETPPYFTPASTFSIAQTCKFVGSRNRYQNPALEPKEVSALTAFTASIPYEPNPFLGADGALAQRVELPNGASGSPRQGMALFEGRCQSCHPPPTFTTDQDPATRGQYMRVGTPLALPLRPEQQDVLDTGFGPPSLQGAWDIFPMLGTGSAGLEVTAEGAVQMRSRWALGEVLEHFSGPSHGNAAALSAAQRNDLAAYVMSL